MEYLPSEIINRPKKGFDMPSLEWFQGDLNPSIYELLCSDESLISAYIDKEEIEKIVLKYKLLTILLLLFRYLLVSRWTN